MESTSRVARVPEAIAAVVDGQTVILSPLDYSYHALDPVGARVWELLREMRCDHAQGYYMGKPMPADEFERWTVGWVGRNRPQAAPLSAPTLH